MRILVRNSSKNVGMQGSMPALTEDETYWELSGSDKSQTQDEDLPGHAMQGQLHTIQESIEETQSRIEQSQKRVRDMETLHSSFATERLMVDSELEHWKNRSEYIQAQIVRSKQKLEAVESVQNKTSEDLIRSEKSILEDLEVELAQAHANLKKGTARNDKVQEKIANVSARISRKEFSSETKRKCYFNALREFQIESKN